MLGVVEDWIGDLIRDRFELCRRLVSVFRMLERVRKLKGGGRELLKYVNASGGVELHA